MLKRILGLAVGGGSVKSKSKNERKAQKHSFKSYVVRYSISIKPDFSFFIDTFCTIFDKIWLEMGQGHHEIVVLNDLP